MTAGGFALQVAAIGGREVGSASLQVLTALAEILLPAAAVVGIAVAVVVRWARARQRHEAPALDASVARHPAGKRREAGAGLEHEINEMIRKYGG